MSRRLGFTLIEISIVLVVVGLLVGGVLAGKTLIRSAQLRAIISDIDEFNAAVMAFKSKYNCLPGDCANATKFFGAWNDCFEVDEYIDAGNIVTDNTTCDGNGNNQITVEPPSGFDYAPEVNLFWQHLGRAKLIAGQYVNFFSDLDGNMVKNVYPTASLPAVYEMGYFSKDYNGNPAKPANYYKISNLSNVNASYNYMMTPSDAYSMDAKMDDGKPLQGILTVDVPGNDNLFAGGCTDHSGADNALYNTADIGEDMACLWLVAKAPF